MGASWTGWMLGKGNHAMISEVSRWLIALGSVLAAVGFTLLGIGLAFVEPESLEITIGTILMIGGIAATIVGGVLYRKYDEESKSGAGANQSSG